MGRIRTVKPQLFFDEELAELSIQARYLFIGLFTIADRRGRLEDRPKNIKANIFPYDKVDVNECLQELTKKFIVRYDVNGKRYIQIFNFEKHQRITGTEASTESEFPECKFDVTEKIDGNNEETIRKQSGNDIETPWTTGREGKGREGKGYMDQETFPVSSQKQKQAFAELQNVLLSPPEFEKLKTHFGNHDEAMVRIERLSLYLASTGKRYLSHYWTLIRWAKNEPKTPELPRKIEYKAVEYDWK